MSECPFCSKKIDPDRAIAYRPYCSNKCHTEMTVMNPSDAPELDIYASKRSKKREEQADKPNKPQKEGWGCFSLFMLAFGCLSFISYWDYDPNTASGINFENGGPPIKTNPDDMWQLIPTGIIFILLAFWIKKKENAPL